LNYTLYIAATRNAGQVNTVIQRGYKRIHTIPSVCALDGRSGAKQPPDDTDVVRRPPCSRLAPAPCNASMYSVSDAPVLTFANRIITVKVKRLILPFQWGSVGA
jgi:hypothetical protein